ncbi:SNF2 family N-terminal domain-containing protein [Schizophyllum amplum]|uniref:SNF2 family N-terminal domain-containing protein n=1 Tax=Schizophyllum amplum TaxID=97359 RepID=A0A550CMC6_9AGAR|nr:SNF2 family N-terminal domain-containing protein [Auriculariopsis ampla]
MRLSIHIRPTPSAKSDIGDSEAGFSEAQDELDEDESDDDAADDEEYDEEDVHALQTRRSTRTAANKPRDLPFSPRKTRSQKIYTIDDSDESEGDDAGGSPHRMSCEKCHMPPAHQEIERLQKKKRKGGRRKKKNQDEFEDSDDEVERESKKGGWVRCLKCAVSAHFGCLASAQRDEILKAAKARDIAAWREQNPDGDPKEEPAKRKALQVDETTDFVCGGCMKGGICMSCEKVALLPGGRLPTEKPPTADIEMADPSGDVEMTDGTAKNGVDGPVRELLFRCLTCKRMAHYEHLPPPNGDSDTPSEIAAYYQRDTRWLCDDCNSCVGESLDKILAWKPYPANAAQPPDPVHYKDNLPREYLVKWDNRSYRRVQWVPHMWLVSTSPQKLKHFLAVGAKVDLLDEATARKKAAAEAEDSGHLSDVEETPEPNGSLPLQTKDGLVDAEARIPKEWTTVDRVLDFILWNPNKPAKVKGKKGKGGKNKRKQRIESDDEDEMDEELIQIREDIFKNGTTPAEAVTETLEEWEARMRRKFTVDDIDDVVWAFIKWQELGYEEATWDAPPREGEPGYADFKRALERNLIGRTVTVPRKMPQRIEDRPKKGFEPYHLEDASELKIGQDPALKLMPFQVDGFNWLCDNWWNHQPCILADEMGLGKTVQVSSFVGNIIDKWQAFPALVVVPNSTLTNWVREFERWAPKLRVVPYYGEAKARQVIQRYELSHPKTPPNCTDAKFHVLVTSYEAVTHKTDFGAVFKKQPRWEVLIIDEGQRLKNDKSLLFQKLNDLKAKHRVIMTGTPLNNNIRELFNLMNFLEPEKWADLEALEAEYEELTEDLVKQLHDRLRPYFLRRIKSEVLQLPPKNEVIVPVSMSPIQKELYRSILSKNVDILNGLRSGAGNTKSQGTNNVKNILMQLRK